MWRKVSNVILMMTEKCKYFINLLLKIFSFKQIICYSVHDIFHCLIQTGLSNENMHETLVSHTNKEAGR